jgi:guanosine-3',5'-bis(diphosphate) 3'-pyrophosphohydrolase
VPDIEEIKRKLGEYKPDADFQLVDRAYNFAKKYHEKQFRMDGSEFMTHPLSVAEILTRLHMDEVSIASALLHDVAEDTAVTIEEIKKEFGDKIAFLVDSLTKLSSYQFRSKKVREAENFRKMLFAMSKDIRVILIKLADRLHNMQTLSALPPEKQLQISTETMEIYVPIAHRLGIYWLKAELEDLAFSYLKPEVYQRIKNSLASIKPKADEYIKRVSEMIKRKLEENGIKAEVNGRFKHIYGIYKKMEKYQTDVFGVHDIFAFRIIVDDIPTCYHVLGLVHSFFPPVLGSVKDYIALPKINNYRSLHTIVIGPEGRRIEIQIRTHEMHKEAEEGIAAHWIYKEGQKISEDEIEKYVWLRQLIEAKNEHPDALEFVEAVKEDIFSKEIYVFTPKGDVIELPKGSTPVDFAYYIHTELGNTCVGAKVNGIMVPLDHELKTGDLVEIITSKNQKPRRDWLKFVVTERARSKIKSFLRKEEREMRRELGREYLLNDVKKTGLPKSILEDEEIKAKLVAAAGVQSMDELLEKIGSRAILPSKLLATVFPEKRVEAQKKKEIKEGEVIIAGERGISFRIAKCCSPIPGEPIVGIITKRGGLSVHHKGCARIKDVPDEMRVVVEWGKESGVEMEAVLQVIGIDRPGLLADISSNISKHKINITDLKMWRNKVGNAEGRFKLAVRNISELKRVIDSIESVPGVIYVKRLGREGIL